MVNKLSDLISGESVAIWILIAFLVFYFLYKEWPEFRRRVSSGPLKESLDAETDRTVNERLGLIESDVRDIKDKLSRDYLRINQLELRLDRTKDTQADLMQELEIIMRALLGVLRGLQEQGANGPTKEAETEIQEYLTKKAHSMEKSIT